MSTTYQVGWPPAAVPMWVTAAASSSVAGVDVAHDLSLPLAAGMPPGLMAAAILAAGVVGTGGALVAFLARAR